MGGRGGVKAARVSIGGDDELGYGITKDPVKDVHDLHATMMPGESITHIHLQKIYQGRNFRLTDVRQRHRQSLWHRRARWSPYARERLSWNPKLVRVPAEQDIQEAFGLQGASARATHKEAHPHAGRGLRSKANPDSPELAQIDTDPARRAQITAGWRGLKGQLRVRVWRSDRITASAETIGGGWPGNERHHQHLISRHMVPSRGLEMGWKNHQDRRPRMGIWDTALTSGGCSTSWEI